MTQHNMVTRVNRSKPVEYFDHGHIRTTVWEYTLLGSTTYKITVSRVMKDGLDTAMAFNPEDIASVQQTLARASKWLGDAGCQVDAASCLLANQAIRRSPL